MFEPAKYPSKERVERDDHLLHAVGDDLIHDLDEARRQGYNVDGDPAAGEPRIATERVVVDEHLLYAEGDVIPPDAVIPALVDPLAPADVDGSVAPGQEEQIDASSDQAVANQPKKAPAKKAPAKKP